MDCISSQKNIVVYLTVKSLLCTWDQHNILYQLYLNKNISKKNIVVSRCMFVKT